jgi:two-component system response regulator
MRSGIILLVEDRDDDIELTLRAFNKSGVGNEVVVVRDGVEALEYLMNPERQSGQLAMPEVVLLDLNLPKVSGLEVLRRVRDNERLKRVPVVVLTSSNEDRDIVASYDLGANSFIQKPVDFAQFIEATRQLGLYWLLLNRVAPA